MKTGYVILSMFVSVLISVATAVAVVQYILPQSAQPQQIVYFNMQKVVEDFVISTAKENLEKTAVKAKVQHFSTDLQQTLTALAKKHDVIVLSKAAVVAGGIDITDAYMHRTRGQDNDRDD